jgi:DNA-binding MarR family transcriptional regulator
MRDSRTRTIPLKAEERQPRGAEIAVSHLTGKLFRHIARVHNQALKPFEVSAVQANILALLWFEGPMTMGEVQARLALGSSTLTGAIDRMEKVELVRRVAVPGDRRAFRLEPAGWPQKRRDALLERLAQTEREAFSGLTAAERRELVRLLDKAVTSIAQTGEVGAGDGD